MIAVYFVLAAAVFGVFYRITMPKQKTINKPIRKMSMSKRYGHCKVK